MKGRSAPLPEAERLHAPGWLAALPLLALFAGLSVWEMWEDSATFDEIAHIPAGYAYWKAREFSLNPEHPPLVKLLATLPLLPMQPDLPPTKPEGGAGDLRAYQWKFGSRFLFSHDADRILFRARLPVVVLGLLLGVLVFAWASRLHKSVGAGSVSLFLFALEPTILAHSHYVTTDVAAATFATMAFFFLWRFAEQGLGRDLLLASFGLGLALASKFTAVVFVPVFAVLFLVSLGGKRERLSERGTTTVAGLLMLPVIIVALTVQGSYLFSPDPLLYFRGLQSLALEQNVGWATYVNGAFYQGGVWWYPLYAFILKTPIPTLAAMTIGTALYARSGEGTPRALYFLLLPAAAYTIAICTFAPNIGARYMIPVSAFLLVLAGGCWTLLKTRKGQLATALLAVWLAVSVLRVSPHYISYFNELIGGPANAAYYLDDSNVDWGQDLKRLMRYLRENGIREVYLSYWGLSPAEYYAARDALKLVPLGFDLLTAPNPPSGLYVISVNHLVGMRRILTLHPSVPRTADWLTRFKPSDRIGYSIYIYSFSPERLTP